MRRLLLALPALAALTGAGCHKKPPRVVPDVVAPAIDVPASARRALSLTVYAGHGQGYAFVREDRAVRIHAGRFHLRALEVASTIVPETTRFELISLDEDDQPRKAAELYEQRYLYDRLSPSRLLEKSEGQRITATWWAGGRSGHEQSMSGVLLTRGAEAVVRLDSGDIVPVPPGSRISFPGIPQGLVEKPTLGWSVGSYEPADALLRLTYRANGFRWQADYVVAIDRVGARADVEGWITVTNPGDTAFDNATLQLAAGEIHEAPPPPAVIMLADAVAEMPAPEPAPHATEERLGEVHLYTISHPTDLPARSTKQVRFVAARDVPLRLEARSEPPLASGAYPSELVAVLEHGHQGPLAVPLPKGTARVSALSSAAVPVLVGEDATDHTPAGEPWKVRVGSDADQLTRVVVKEDRRTGRDRDGAGIWHTVVSYELRNASTAPRHRRVLVTPGRGRIERISKAEGLRSDGPARAILELDLPAGASRTIEVAMDRVDPYDRGTSYPDVPEPEVEELP